VQLLLEEFENGEHWPNWQLPLGQSELKVQALGSFPTVRVGLEAESIAAQPTARSRTAKTQARLTSMGIPFGIVTTEEAAWLV